MKRIVALLLGVCLMLLTGCTLGQPVSSDPPASSDLPDTAEPGSEEVENIAVLTDYTKYVKEDDWTLAIKMALKDADVVYIPNGRYRTSTIKLASGKTIRGAGENTVLVPIDDTLISIEGTAGREISLGQDCEDFTNTLELKTKEDIKAGDYIYLLGQRNVYLIDDCGEGWCLGGTYESGKTAFFGEFLTVESVVDGKIITTKENRVFPYYLASGENESTPPEPPSEKKPADWPYMRSKTTVRKISPVTNVVLEDFSVEASSGDVINCMWARDCTFSGIRLVSPEGVTAERGFSFIRIKLSVGVTARDCACIILGKIDATAGEGFAVVSTFNPFGIASSYSCGFERCHTNLSTIGFNINRLEKYSPSYDCYVKNCTAEEAVWYGIYVGQATWRNSVTGNTVRDCALGVAVSGRAVRIADNVIETDLPFSTDYYAARVSQGGTAGVLLFEGFAIDSVVENNKIKGARSGILIRDGGEKTNIFTFGSITVRNNDISGCKNDIFKWFNKHNTVKQVDIITE